MLAMSQQVVRLNLAQRMSLPEICDSTPLPQRHYEAIEGPGRGTDPIAVRHAAVTLGQNEPGGAKAGAHHKAVAAGSLEAKVLAIMAKVQ